MNQFQLHYNVTIRVGVFEARCGRQIPLGGDMFYVHVDSESLPHHRYGARESPLTPTLRILVTSRRRSDTTTLVVLSLLQGTRRAARCGLCCTWTFCSTVRTPTLFRCCKVFSCPWGASSCRFRGSCCHFCCCW